MTNEPVTCTEDAWKIAQTYAHRWQIESNLRFNKSELALESPRVWSWEGRLKLIDDRDFGLPAVAAPLVSTPRKVDPGDPDSALQIA